MKSWELAQTKELDWQVWYYTEHIPLTRRYQIEGYRLCEGRYMMQHCGIPAGGLAPQEITGTLLDDGCGAVSVWEHRPDLDVMAIDPLMADMAKHPQLSKFAKVGPKHNALYLSQNLEAIGKSGYFDWVWCYNVLDHAEDWRQHLAHCKRVLKVGGVLLLGTDVRTDDYDFSAHDDEADMHPGVFSASEVLGELHSLDFHLEWFRPAAGIVHNYDDAIEAVEKFGLKHPKFRLGVRARK